MARGLLDGPVGRDQVRAQSGARAMQADGFTDFIEVGAGHTLSGLIEKIGGAAHSTRVEDATTLADTVAYYKEGTLC